MSQPSTHHLFKTVPFAQSRRALRKAWVAIALGAVCGLASVTVNAKPMSESAIQSRTVRSDEAGVVLQTRRGDSLRTIAQYYSVKNNIPFKQALEVLTQTNQAQFPGGDPDRMQVGAQIVLPKQGTAASESSKPEPTVAASSANETTAASSAGVAADATQAAIVHAVPVAPTPSASPPQTEPTVSTQVATTAAQGGMAQLKAWFLRVPKSLWLVIIPALLLSAFVWLMMRGSRQGKDDAATDDLTVNDVTEKVAPSTVAPVQAEQVAQTENQTPAQIVPEAPEAALSERADSDKPISNQTVDSWLDGSETPTQVVAKSVQSADAERPTVTAVPAAVQPPVIVESLPAQADSVAITETVTQTNHVAAQEKTFSAEVTDEVLDVKPDAAQEIELRFKQALHGLTPEKLDLRSTSASKVQLDTPAAAVAPIKPVIPMVAPTMPAKPVTVAATMPNTAQTTATAAPNDSGASGLNVNHLLRQYANHTAEKSGQAVNYYALAERTRLQKWMSAQSMDDLLDHAQKAYAQAYPNVAHHILNEVILRGNAAQSTQALDLRNQWHIQYLRQQAQESRGH
ncbi:MAG: hypothetical protein WAS93_09940 [Burkholderiaceae bacterium]